MMFLYYLFLTIAKMSPTEITPLCHLAVFVFQYSQMSTFFWLSAIGFNVWNSFRKMEDPGRSKSNTLGIYDKRYKWYALYSWGCPAVITLVTLIMQYGPQSPSLVHPNIGLNSCALEQTWALLYYSHIFIGPLLVIKIKAVDFTRM